MIAGNEVRFPINIFVIPSYSLLSSFGGKEKKVILLAPLKRRDH